MKDPDHLDKIKKLLRLSKSSNPHEAELALQKAMEMATKHAVDLEQFKNDPEVGGMAHEYMPAPARLAREWKSALNVVATFFHVTPVVDARRKRVLLVGRADAIIVGEYVVGFLVRTCRRHVAQFGNDEERRKRRMTSGKKAAFIEGFFIGIRRVLNSALDDMLKANETLAIVISDESWRRSEMLSTLVGKTKDLGSAKPARRSDALYAGFHAGLDTKINKPLETGAPERLALT